MPLFRFSRFLKPEGVIVRLDDGTYGPTYERAQTSFDVPNESVTVIEGRQGDTFHSIALRRYGTAVLWFAIANATDPAEVFFPNEDLTGKTIRVPSLAYVKANML